MLPVFSDQIKTIDRKSPDADWLLRMRRNALVLP